VTPQISGAMEERFIVDPRRPHGPKHLTGMPCEVLRMLAEGRSMKEIAFVLQIAHRTVRFHKSRILEELGFTTNLDLVKYALKHGMISSA
jgi:DNA-binding NarL/FixJ family response regulator